MANSPASDRLAPIVIVEDNPDDGYVVARRLAACGAKNPIVSFHDGDDAIAYLETVLAKRVDEDHALPCLLITDIKTYGADGFAIVRWARSQPRLAAMKIYFLTATDRSEDRTRAAELGADGYFTKFPAPEVFTAVLAATSC
jgi:CheY-like chemotaxis protein